jgi:hypothetical protein
MNYYREIAEGLREYDDQLQDEWEAAMRSEMEDQEGTWRDDFEEEY